LRFSSSKLQHVGRKNGRVATCHVIAVPSRRLCLPLFSSQVEANKILKGERASFALAAGPKWLCKYESAKTVLLRSFADIKITDRQNVGIQNLKT
jgi:hypothetical protein